MHVDELDFELPGERIATEPADPRDAARLMVVRRPGGGVAHHRGRDLPTVADLLRPGDLMVFNQSKVLPAWFAATRSATGGQVTGLYLGSEVDGESVNWQVMLESGGKLREGERVALDDDSTLQLLERQGEGRWLARLDSPMETLAVLGKVGRPPLPPYIRRQRRQQQLPEQQLGDIDRYNTVYAAEPGSVAAPTAGLHFTPALLAQLQSMGVTQAFVTLHVGLGTFAPVRVDRLEEHAIHEEWISIPPATLAALRETRARGGRIIPVGTTTVRALESLPEVLPGHPTEPICMSTGLYILPPEPGREPFRFRYCDALMTNFHLPRSTLLALVAALPDVGVERLLGWYQQAIDQQYRFYSYGDAMLIW